MSTIAEAQTEAVIKEKAKTLFFQKGFLNATTQEIADEAGVNRALIHYYFRSRDQLMDTLLEEAVNEKRERARAVLSSALPFREKISLFIDIVVEYGLKYPYLENFIITETARNPEKVKVLCQTKIRSSDLIRKDLEEEIAQGRLLPITAEHFVINLISLCNYPLLAKTVLQNMHGMSDTAYRKFLLDRKEIIYHAIFHEPLPRITRKEEHPHPKPAK
ncbi:TetR/AcrR family transcriptional regulator [Chryseolinea soli]|uniref:TetR/AcrR family transcriptional regulator n=1 Tax=Chryseolinea soli TaxID=2321403 RepID=A0A385SXB4_9BACT|nr:TetR/AcrR family transcriptional regulator [Chryseolinea soli]AYB34370.1 TetR/AcrR family transcriptional regulator [Chryseolinea soli]